MKVASIAEMLNVVPPPRPGSLAQVSDESPQTFKESLLAASKASSGVATVNAGGAGAARRQKPVWEDAKLPRPTMPHIRAVLSPSPSPQMLHPQDLVVQQPPLINPALIPVLPPAAPAAVSPGASTVPVGQPMLDTAAAGYISQPALAEPESIPSSHAKVESGPTQTVLPSVAHVLRNAANLSNTVADVPQNAFVSVVPKPLSNAVLNANAGVADVVPSVLPDAVQTIVPNTNPRVTQIAVPSAVTNVAAGALPNAASGVQSFPFSSAVASPVASAVSSPVANTVSNPVESGVTSPVENAISGVMVAAVSTPMLSAVSNIISTALPTPILSAVSNLIPTALPTPMLSAVSNLIPTALPTLVSSAVQNPLPNTSPTAVPVTLGKAVPGAVARAIPSAVPAAVGSALPGAVQNSASPIVPNLSANSSLNAAPVPVAHGAVSASPKPEVALKASAASTGQPNPPPAAPDPSGLATGLTVPGATADQLVALIQPGRGLFGTAQPGVSGESIAAVAKHLDIAVASGKDGSNSAVNDATGLKPHAPSASGQTASQTNSQGTASSGDQSQTGASQPGQSLAPAQINFASHTMASMDHAQNAAVATPLQTAPTPVGISGHTAKTPDTPAPAAIALPQAVPVINTAKLIQSMGQSEMRVGMRSNEFGNISISTSATRDLISAQISLEHSELARTLATHLPEMQARLGGNQHMDVRIDMNGQQTGQGMGTSAGMSNGSAEESHGNRQQKGSAPSSQSAGGFAGQGNTVAAAALPAAEARLNPRLDITA